MKPRINWAARIDWLKDQYATRSALSIAQQMGVGEQTVKDALRRYGINRGGEKPARSKTAEFGEMDFRREIRDPKWKFEKPTRHCAYTTSGYYTGQELKYRR